MPLTGRQENRVISIDVRKEITNRLLSVLIKPFVTADWWEKTLILIEKISQDIPVYTLRFDRRKEVMDVLGQLIA